VVISVLMTISMFFSVTITFAMMIVIFGPDTTGKQAYYR
jgi:hypothetical protein